MYNMYMGVYTACMEAMRGLSPENWDRTRDEAAEQDITLYKYALLHPLLGHLHLIRPRMHLL